MMTNSDGHIRGMRLGNHSKRKYDSVGGESNTSQSQRPRLGISRKNLDLPASNSLQPFLRASSLHYTFPTTEPPDGIEDSVFGQEDELGGVRRRLFVNDAISPTTAEPGILSIPTCSARGRITPPPNSPPRHINATPFPSSMEMSDLPQSPPDLVPTTHASSPDSASLNTLGEPTKTQIQLIFEAFNKFADLEDHLSWASILKEVRESGAVAGEKPAWDLDAISREEIIGFFCGT
ncbi:hypothetical protein NM208_g6005 [Fusarium decemcellulare]|uniref:Uncharacterized protein n=1 Tax=Fusarium decemcellulare TaxID=57161 RepID=A0ACC1SEX9_9HYPO|nr:hypothetical protein NM208_g6005 [Fusarium decemcellulare]